MGFTFKNLSLSCFQHFEYSIHVWISFLFSYLEFVEILGCVDILKIKFRKSFVIISLNICSNISLSLSSYYFHYAHVCELNDVPPFSRTLLILLHSLFLSWYIICIDLSLSSLILSSDKSNLLLSVFDELFNYYTVQLQYF